MTSRCDIEQVNFGHYANNLMSLKLWEKENKTIVVISIVESASSEHRFRRRYMYRFSRLTRQFKASIYCNSA